MANLGSLSVFLNANTSKFDRGMSRARRSINRLSSLSIRASAVIGTALAGMGIAAIKFAADGDEVRNKFDVVFSDIAKSANDAADAIADKFDLANTTVREMLSSTGDLLTGFGFTQSAALDMSKQINELAGDLASFNNVQGGAAEASERLRKGVLGETEGLKMLGIVIQQNTKEFKNRIATAKQSLGLTDLQAKAHVILQTAIEQSKNAMGDYTRTQDSLVNSSRAANEQLKNISESFGRVLKSALGAAQGMSSVRDQLKQVSKFISANERDWSVALGSIFIKAKASINGIIDLYELFRDNSNDVVKGVTVFFYKAYEEAFNAVINKAKSFVKLVMDSVLVIDGFIVGVANTIKEVFVALYDNIQNIIDGIGKVVNLAKQGKFIQAGAVVVGGINESIDSAVELALSNIVDKNKQLYTNLSKSVDQFVGSELDLGKILSTALDETLGVLPDDFRKKFDEIIKRYDDSVRNEINALKESVKAQQLEDKKAATETETPGEVPVNKFAKALQASSAAAFNLRTGRDDRMNKIIQDNARANGQAAASLATIVAGGVSIKNLKTVDSF